MDVIFTASCTGLVFSEYVGTQNLRRAQNLLSMRNKHFHGLHSSGAVVSVEGGGGDQEWSRLWQKAICFVRHV